MLLGVLQASASAVLTGTMDAHPSRPLYLSGVLYRHIILSASTSPPSLFPA